MRVVLSFWPQRAGSEQRPRFFGKVARLALALDEPGLASGLLAPLGPDRITAESASALVAAAERYLDVGGPDQVPLIFDRRVTRRTPAAFAPAC